MKSKFTEFYGLSDAEFAEIWRDAFIIFDTNVLLNVYRLPDDVRDEFLNLLENLKDRLWVPYQVAMEYQRRRLDVISQRKKHLAEKKLAINESIGTLRREVESVEIQKHDIDADVAEIFAKIDEVRDVLESCLTEILDSHVDLSISDPIRDRLDRTLGDHVGEPPKDQSHLDEIQNRGRERYAIKKPPGYEDKVKEKDPLGAYDHGGLRYESQFGDLILWEQIIEWCNKRTGKSVIFVTADTKDDWWLRISGKTIGPRPELIEEISSRGGVKRFWMYSFSNFGKYAKQYLDAKLSERSIEQISMVADKKVKSTTSQTTDLFSKFREASKLRPISRDLLLSYAFQWLHQHCDSVMPGRYCDFVAMTEGQKIGYKVAYTRNNTMQEGYSAIWDALHTARTVAHEERVERFEIILMFDQLEEMAVDQLYHILSAKNSFDVANDPDIPITMVAGSISYGNFIPAARVDESGNVLFP